jgi:hypothetical protein
MILYIHNLSFRGCALHTGGMGRDSKRLPIDARSIDSSKETAELSETSHCIATK